MIARAAWVARAASFAVALALSATSARAAPGDATRLEYARSARAVQCPERAVLEAAVAKRLGYNPFFPAARQTIVVEITDTDAGLRAAMQLIDEHGLIVGSRELSERAEQCDELVASLALAISIALDPSAALETAPSDPPEPSQPAADPPSKPEPEPEAANSADDDAAKRAPEPRLTHAERPKPSTGKADGPASIAGMLRVGAFSSWGFAPSRASGARVGAGLRHDWLEIVVELSDQFPATRAADAGGSVKGSLYDVAVAPCFAGSWFAACPLFEVGSLHTEGIDLPNPASRNLLQLAAGARLEAAPHVLRQLQLVFDADALRSFTPVTLRLHQAEVWRTPWLSLVLGAGLSLEFP